MMAQDGSQEVRCSWPCCHCRGGSHSPTGSQLFTSLVWLCWADPDHCSIACCSHTFSSSVLVVSPLSDPSVAVSLQHPPRWFQTPSTGMSFMWCTTFCLLSCDCRDPQPVGGNAVNCQNMVPYTNLTSLSLLLCPTPILRDALSTLTFDRASTFSASLRRLSDRTRREVYLGRGG